MTLAVILLGIGTLAKAGTPPLPDIPTNQFNILNFGAFGNGVSNNAAAIQSAINAAGAAGGGTVIVSAVGVSTNYLSGPFNLTNNVSLQIDGGTKLQMLPYGSYPGSTSFISGAKLHDVEISGSGTIDGQGAAWWSAFSANTNLARPTMVKISDSTRVLVQAVTLQNPPIYHLVLADGNVAVTVQSITINTPSPSPNTDGIDLGATNCLIQNCFISGGDDNISLKPSSAVSADIVISNCTFGTGHGVSVGSGTTGGLQNMTVSNCSFNGTTYGIRMKSDNDRGGLVQNLQYFDLTMTNVAYPLVIYSYYNEVGTPNNITPATAAGEPVAATNSLTPIWRNITISNVVASATTGNNIAGIIWGRPEMVVSNVLLSNVRIAAPTKTFNIYNARAIQLVDSPLEGPNTTTNTLNLYNAQVTITNSAPSTNLVTLGGLSRPPTNNVLALFNARAAIANSSMLGPDPLLTLGQSTLTVSNDLPLGGTSTLNFAVGTNATKVAVTGNLTLGGTLNVADGGGFTTGTYTLFTYGGTLTGSGLGIGAAPAGYNYAISTNTLDQVNLVVSSTTPPTAPFTAWQLQYFGSTNCARCGGDADFDGDGMSNTNEFLAGTDPTNSASALRIISVASQDSDMVITWTTAGGHTNAVQTKIGSGDGGYTTNFMDLSGSIVIQGSGDVTTNYIDVGGATNTPSRFYRVRLVQ